MKKVTNFFRLPALLAFVAIIGQSFTASVVSPEIVRGNGEIILKQGTSVSIRLYENINSANVEIGTPVTFEVANPVIVDGVEVISQGTLAEGEITALDRLDGCADCQGKYESIEIKVDKVKAVDGQMVWLYGKPLVVRSKCPKCPVELRQGLRLASTVQSNVRIKVK